MTTKHARLGDVLELIRDPVDIDPGEPYRKIGVRGFGRGIFHYPEMPGDQLGKLRFYQLRPHELVISNIKAWEGAIAVSGEQDVPAVASNRFLTYRPKESGEVDVDYLRFLLLSEAGLHVIGQQSPGSVDRNRTLGIKAFEAIEVSLPAIDQQRRVAELLAQAWRIQERVEEREQLFDALSEAAIHDAFDPQVVRDWPFAPASDLLQIQRHPVQIDPDDPYRKLGIRSFGKGLIRYQPSDGRDLGKLRFYRVVRDALIISNIKAWEGAISVTGTDDEDLVASNRFLSYTARDSEATSVSFLRHYLLSHAGLSAIQSASPGSVDRNRTLGMRAFEVLPLPCPPVAVQSAVDRRISSVRQSVRRWRMEAEPVQSLVPSVSNEMFSHLG